MYSWSSPPMWSMTSGKRGEELKAVSSTYNPGPGTYDETSQKFYKTEYPSWKVGKGERGNLYSSTNPKLGPGSYDIDKKKVPKNKPNFSKANKGQSELKGIPAVGPGSYESRTFVGTAPNFSFGYKGEGFGNFDRSKTPGPGAYEINNVFDDNQKEATKYKHHKAAFLRTAPNSLTQNIDPSGKIDAPGPGAHYNPNVDNYDFRYFAPTFSIGKANRDDLYDEARNIPGPGKYHIPGQIKTKGGFTILGKNQGKANMSDTPAPNAYNQQVDPLRQTAPAFRIGKAERKGMASGDEAVPGPGAYHRVQQGSSKGAKIGTSTRPGFYAHATTPGPGSYDVTGNIGKHASKYSMGGRLGSKRPVDFQPGPGEYDPFATLYMEKTNGAIIGESQRPALYKKGMAPGPGQYDVRGDITANGTKSKFGMGRRVPIAKVNDEPGPGYYNLPSAIGNVPKYQTPGYASEKIKAMNADAETSYKGIFG